MELNNWTKSQEYLKVHPMRLNYDNKLIEIKVLPILKFCDNILYTSFCDGDNLENELVEGDRNRAVCLLLDFVDKIKESGFLWGDFAPRNMILKDSVLWLCDFERETKLKCKPVSDVEIDQWFRGYAWEELSCFLTNDEQNQYLNKFLLSEECHKISIDNITSTRKKLLLEELFGFSNFYDTSHLHEIGQLMSDIATPFIVDGRLFYPMQFIDLLASYYGKERYVDIAIQMICLNNKERFDLLCGEFYDYISSSCKLEKKFDSYALVKNSQNRYIIFNDTPLAITIKNGGYVPKSGLLLVDYLSKNSDKFKNEPVLDIGTGETAIIAHYLHSIGADVTACDIDSEAIAHSSKSSPVAYDIEFYVSNVFDSIPEDKRFKYIFSNPPQMPMQKGNAHDSGGLNGRDVILKILDNQVNRLLLGGSIIMLLFDFLGINKSFNEGPSLSDVASKYGLSTSIISTSDRPIRKGGTTESSIPWIKSIYPKYEWNAINPKHEVCIVEFTK